MGSQKHVSENRFVPDTQQAALVRAESAARAPDAALQADVVIVGAGYTGLWTAYYLLKSDPSLRVVLLEKREVGFGASGRNGGWASAIFPISLPRVAQMYSHAAALQLQAAMNETVDEIGRVLALEGVDADYAKQGFLSLARSTPQMERVRAAVAASTQFGLSEQWQVLEGGRGAFAHRRRGCPGRALHRALRADSSRQAGPWAGPLGREPGR